MKRLITLIATGIWTSLCFGQSDSTHTIPEADSSKTKATLTLGAVYSNNASYYGLRAEESMPYTAVAASYRFRSGFYFTGMAYKLLNDTASFVSASSLGAGKTFNLSKKLSADLSYSHTFYPAYSPFLQAANADNASASLTYENWLSSTANIDYAFGKTRDIFVTVGIGKTINLGSLGKKDVITSTPAVDVVAGTQHFYKTYIIEKRLRDSLLGQLLPPLLGSSPGNSTPATATTVSTSFDILSYNFKFPLTYNRAHYLVEAAYQLSVLGKKANSGPGKANSFLSISLYYQF